MLASQIIIFAQQYQHFTDYFVLKYIYFPSYCVDDTFYRSISVVRHQWIKIADAPRTYLTSLNGPLYSNKLYGNGMIYADFSGPTRRTSGMLSIAYRVIISESDSIYMGLSMGGGIQTFTIDQERLTFSMEDPLATRISKDNFFDGIASMSLISRLGTIAFSFYQIFYNRIELIEGTSNNKNRAERHISIILNPQINITSLNSKISIYLLGKYVSPVPFQIDAGIRFVYKDIAWIGGFYRTLDAWGLALGTYLSKQTAIGYSLDIPHTNMRSAGGTSHEITLTIKFGL